MEVPDVEPRHLSRRSDGRHYALKVVSGKDTTGEYVDGKQRETWVPVETEQLINRYVQSADIAPDEPIFDLTTRALMKWVRKAGERAVEETGDSDYRRVSTHDLRRSWANHLLVEEGVSPRIVMALGGWSSYDAIEPYLAAPTEANIIETMSAVSL